MTIGCVIYSKVFLRKMIPIGFIPIPQKFNLLQSNLQQC